jgi:hypothetical protein
MLDKKLISKKSYYSNCDLNLTYCRKHYKAFDKKIKGQINKLCPVKKSKVKNMSTNDVKMHVIKALDSYKDIFLNVDYVLIENQPAMVNPTMKAVADSLYMWCMIRGIIDSDQNNSTIKEIRFVSASNKLKDFNQTEIKEAKKEATTSHSKKVYDMTKKLSIQMTKTILASYNYNDWLNRISLAKKQDDYADSFLQGWYVLNEAFSNKLYDEWQINYATNVIITENTQEDNDIDSLNVLDLTNKTKSKTKIKNKMKKNINECNDKHL